MRDVLLFLAAVQAAPPAPGPPPPPPVAGRQSYDAIDRLAFAAGEWTGTRERGTGHPTTVSWRIGRSGGQDYLLIDQFEHWSDPPAAVFGPRDAGELMLVTFDAARGGYRLYLPGFYALRAGDRRGQDEPADIRIDGRSLRWTMPVSGGRQRTIRIDGDELEETLVYLADRSVIYRTRLRRTRAKLIWGEPAG